MEPIQQNVDQNIASSIETAFNIHRDAARLPTPFAAAVWPEVQTVHGEEV